jgi:hypothetical protein
MASQERDQDLVNGAKDFGEISDMAAAVTAQTAKKP